MTREQIRKDINKLFKIVELIGSVSPKIETMDCLEAEGSKAGASVETDISSELVEMEQLLIEVLEGKDNVSLAPIADYKKEYLADAYIIRDLLFGDFSSYMWKAIKDLHSCFQVETSILAQNMRDTVTGYLKIALKAFQAKTRV